MTTHAAKLAALPLGTIAQGDVIERLLGIIEDVDAGYDCVRVLGDDPQEAKAMARELLAARKVVQELIQLQPYLVNHGFAKSEALAAYDAACNPKEGE